jgi:hypothetical protein
VRALLKRGAALNQKRNDGFTALALAAFFGQEDIVRELLVCGAEVRPISRNSTSPEMWASARGFLEIADLLKTAGGQSTGACSAKAFSTSAPTISQIYRLQEVTSAPIKLEREVDPVIPFSPFSALLDRLSSSWQQSAVVFLVVTILSVVVTFTILKAVKRRPQPSHAQAVAATNSPEPTERRPLSATQPVPTEQPKLSVNSSAEKTPSAEVSSRSSDHVTAANANPLPSYESSSIQSANRGAAKGRLSATVSFYGSEGVRSARTRRRVAGMATAPDNSNGPTETTRPAAVAEEYKPQVQRNTKVTGDIPSLPADPIKGSTTKRKVIQWP